MSAVNDLDVGMMGRSRKVRRESGRDGQGVGLVLPVRYVAGYVRISEDDPRHVREREGVENQRQWFYEWARATYPGVPTRVFEDNDVSGASGDRDDFSALQDAVGRGEVIALWTRDQSRLMRDELMWFGFKRVMQDAGLTHLHTLEEGTRDLDDIATGIQAVFDADRRRKDRKFLMRRQNADAHAGRPPAGVTVFGYRRVVIDGERTLEIVPEEAELVRWVAAEILSGRSLHSLARELQDRGVCGAKGSLIRNTAQVVSLVSNVTVAGLRQHQGTIVGPGNWDAILDEGTWRDVAAVLEARSKTAKAQGASKGGAARRKYMLSGIATCQRCGVTMGGSRTTKEAGRADALRYLCRTCGTTIATHVADGVVLDGLTAHLGEVAELADQVTADDLAGRRDAIHDELAGIDARRRKLAALWGAGDLDDVDWQEAREAMNARRDELAAELATLTADGPTEDTEAVAHAVARARTLAQDETADPAERRQAVEDLRGIVSKWAESVVIAPSVRGQDPASRVTVTWQ